MEKPAIVSAEEWQLARDELLKAERGGPAGLPQQRPRPHPVRQAGGLGGSLDGWPQRPTYG
ncbi:hypothetical protein ACF9IK_31370 [Kitasatospora hibisci]|uniref:hypothetical protein n=1 Tax=Kitasatospora hibisci TaxID=3369522 RepID=UPI003754184A